MRYLIDGYNLLFRLGLQHGSAERARRRFCDFLADLLGDRSGDTTIVFDARRLPQGVPPEQTYRGLRLLFAVGRPTADDLIADLVEQDGHPQDLAVVSDDQQVRLAARQGRARDLTGEAFLDEVETTTRKRPAAGTDEAADKPDSLTDEERRTWLEAFGDLEQDPDLRDGFPPRDF